MKLDKIIIFIVVLLTVPSHSQDVYNFYFQKGEGKKVKQVKDGQVVSNSDEEVTKERESVKPSKKLSPQSKTYFEVALGVSSNRFPYRSESYKRIDENEHEVYSKLEIDYKFNKYVSLNSEFNSNEDLGVGLLIYLNEWINLGNQNLIDLSIGGGHAVQNYYTLNWDYPPFNGPARIKNILRTGYLQVRIRINLFQEMGLILEHKNLEEEGYARNSVALGYRF